MPIPQQHPGLQQGNVAALERQLFEIIQRQQMTRLLRQELEKEQPQSSSAIQRLAQIDIQQTGDIAALLHQLSVQRQEPGRSSPATVGLDLSALNQSLQSAPHLGLGPQASPWLQQQLAQHKDCARELMSEMNLRRRDSQEEWKEFLRQMMVSGTIFSRLHLIDHNCYQFQNLLFFLLHFLPDLLKQIFL